MSCKWDRGFFVTLIAVSSFAGLGCFIRTALSLSFNFWNLLSLIPNIFGTFILGIINGLSLKDKYINTGLGTGLCGSITTFSSFSYEFNDLIVNKQPNIALATAFITITFIGSAIAYFIGECIAKFYLTITEKEEENPSIPETEKVTSTSVIDKIEMTNTHINDESNIPTNIDSDDNSKSDSEEIMVTDKLLIYWIGVFILINAIVIPLCFVLIDNRLWFAILLSPFGACLRWYLGIKYNKKFKIPIGTFCVNIMGALLLTLLLVLSAESEDPRYETLVIEAMTKGFCGCLSTVSSFVAELFGLRRQTSLYIPILYFFLTVVVSQILCSIPNSIHIFA